MSRGYGQLQRQLLDLLDNKPGWNGDVFSLAHHTDAQESSIRRALKRLEDDGLVARERKLNYHGQPDQWYLTAKGERVSLALLLGSGA